MMGEYLHTQFEDQRDRYESYLKSTRLSRLAIKTSKWLFTIFISDLIIMTNLGIDVQAYYVPYSIDALLIKISYLTFIGGPLLYFPGKHFVNKSMDNHVYSDINIPFIYIHSSFRNYGKWLEKKGNVYKNNAKNYLKKTYRVMSYWKYENTPLITNELREKILFIQYDLKTIFVEMINSDDEEDNKKLVQLYYGLINFLYYNQEKFLLELYDSSIKYKGDYEFNEVKKYVDRFTLLYKENRIASFIMSILIIIPSYILVAKYLGVDWETIRNQSLQAIFFIFLFRILMESSRNEK